MHKPTLTFISIKLPVVKEVATNSVFFSRHVFIVNFIVIVLIVIIYDQAL